MKKLRLCLLLALLPIISAAAHTHHEQQTTQKDYPIQPISFVSVKF